MNTDPPNPEAARPNPAVPTLEYANLKDAAPRGEGAATASLVCGLLCFPAAFLMTQFAAPILLLAPLALAFGITARGHEKKVGARPRRRTILGLTLGSVEVGLLVIAAILVPSMGRAKEPANRVKCASNLRTIGQGVLLYANDNQGRFPPTLDELMLTQDLTFEVLICPSTDEDKAQGPTTQAALQQMHAQPGHCSYIYIGGGLTQATATPQHVIAYEPLTNHSGAGMNVLFGDGHAEFLPAAKANYVLAELKAGHNPPRPQP